MRCPRKKAQRTPLLTLPDQPKVPNRTVFVHSVNGLSAASETLFKQRYAKTTKTNRVARDGLSYRRGAPKSKERMFDVMPKFTALFYFYNFLPHSVKCTILQQALHPV